LERSVKKEEGSLEIVEREREVVRNHSFDSVRSDGLAGLKRDRGWSGNESQRK
jgi:hypothetical protein